MIKLKFDSEKENGTDLTVVGNTATVLTELMFATYSIIRLVSKRTDCSIDEVFNKYIKSLNEFNRFNNFENEDDDDEDTIG